MDLVHHKTQLNKNENRFELRLDSELAFIDFKVANNGDVQLIHTEVPLKFKGKGVGHKLVRESLEMIAEDSCLIIPLCPFIRSYIQSNKEDYQNILSPKTKL